MDKKSKKTKQKEKSKPVYTTMPTLNGEFVTVETNVKIPKDSDVEDLREFSKEHKL
ncbi:MAG: hypothetical protein J6A69_10835 [Clostridia bacterium]|nr:hypothetical protein [Clostridia bacterium]